MLKKRSYIKFTTELIVIESTQRTDKLLEVKTNQSKITSKGMKSTKQGVVA